MNKNTHKIPWIASKSNTLSTLCCWDWISTENVSLCKVQNISHVIYRNENFLWIIDKNCLKYNLFYLSRLLCWSWYGVPSLSRMFVGSNQRVHVPNLIFVPQWNPVSTTNFQLWLVVRDFIPFFSFLFCV